jgi:murein DD-endopeptidase MepM/ murein hydrolase activator NlpD
VRNHVCSFATFALLAHLLPASVVHGRSSDEPQVCESRPGCPDHDLLDTALSVRGDLLEAFLWKPVDLVEGPGLSAPHPGAISSPFGPRMHPILGYRRNHNGVDIRSRRGDAVSASGPGIVVEAGWRGGYGNAVEIAHGDEVTTLYAHLDRIDVKVGDVVHRLEVVGAVGTTGLSTGPHLHFEVRIDGSPVDPAPHLPPGGGI